jgi:hypothetical protein
MNSQLSDWPGSSNVPNPHVLEKAKKEKRKA